MVCKQLEVASKEIVAKLLQGIIQLLGIPFGLHYTVALMVLVIDLHKQSRGRPVLAPHQGQLHLHQFAE